MNTNPMNSGGFSDESIATSMSLVNAVVQRDPAAWVKLVQLYYPLVFHWSQKSGMGNEADEIASEVMFKAVKGLRNFSKNEPDQMFRKWLRTIMRNVIADYCNNKPNAFGGSENFLLDIAGQKLDEDPQEIAADRKELFARAIQLLQQSVRKKENFRIFMEVVVHGRSPRHVAEDFKISVGQVYQIKCRCLKKLKTAFDLIDLSD